MTGETRCGAAAVLPGRPLEPPSRRSPSRAAFVSAEKVFASLPQVERGVSKILGGDPKGNNFLYTNGKCVILRNIDVSVPPLPAPTGNWGPPRAHLGCGRHAPRLCSRARGSGVGRRPGRRLKFPRSPSGELGPGWDGFRQTRLVLGCGCGLVWGQFPSPVERGNEVIPTPLSRWPAAERAEGVPRFLAAPGTLGDTSAPC